jgi:hypothetical protein
LTTSTRRPCPTSSFNRGAGALKRKLAAIAVAVTPEAPPGGHVLRRATAWSTRPMFRPRPAERVSKRDHGLADGGRLAAHRLN